MLLDYFIAANREEIITRCKAKVATRSLPMDPHVPGAVVGNLLQNAFKFTRPHTEVALRGGASAERVLIEVEDECRGLPGANSEELFHAFEQRGVDRTGSVRGSHSADGASRANHGRIYARNLPERGCIFTVDLPRLHLGEVVIT